MPLTKLRALFFLAFIALAACSSDSASEGGAGGASQRTDPSQWSDLSARFTNAAARFDFRYANATEGLYKAHLSLLPDFSWSVYFNFASSPESPMVQENPHRVWDGYDCGVPLYWRLEAVGNGILSGIQGPTTVEC